MAGIYIHIPFCKQACHYCDFHFSTNQSYKQETVDAICKELQLQVKYLEQEHIETIYFGGGTPSLLSTGQLAQILDQIYSNFKIDDYCEITLEGNPDDLSLDYLRSIRKLGINRLSIGIQSFNDVVLTFLNRAHNSSQSIKVVHDGRHAGFENISIDLIYSIPNPYTQNWLEDLDEIVKLNPEHISAYALTIEEKTVFGNRHKKGTFTKMAEEDQAHQFELLISKLQKHGYEQYEISNFCRDEMYSKHNSNYWRRVKYLGIGPSAHSYNGISRQYNVSNNARYLKALKNGSPFFEKDTLTDQDKVNEYFMTSLRTKWGCDLGFINEKYGVDVFKSKSKYLQKMVESKFIQVDGSVVFLTTQGKLIADKITEDFFIL